MSTGPTTPQPATSATGGGGLRRELRFWETIALSIAIMAPTAAMALNGTAPAGLIGRAVPLAFIFATVGVLFVSYAFIRLSRLYSHAGSVFAFSGLTLGRGPGSSPGGRCSVPTSRSRVRRPPRRGPSAWPSSAAPASGSRPITS
jgi:amino acid transporter